MINTYSQCGEKYRLHYSLKLRSKVISGALLFGSAIDAALNHLLKTRSLSESKDIFEKVWRWQEINKIGTELQFATNVVYAARDYDGDFLTAADEEKFQSIFKSKFGLETDQSLKQLTTFYKKLKSDNGFNNLSEEQKRVYNYGHWVCLLNKGIIMLDSYNNTVMPKIKEVLSIQEPVSLKNGAGDEVIGYIDMIVRWEDNKVYVMDNKTSASEYKEDSGRKSAQLITYYHDKKEKYGLAGVGFNVMAKQPDKNKVKTCSKCCFNGSEGRHKTCPQEIEGIRCAGAWEERIEPKGRTEIIINEVPSAAEDLVISVYDKALEGIQNEVYIPNLQACGDFDSDWRCQFYSKCWNGKEDDLVKV